MGVFNVVKKISRKISGKDKIWESTAENGNQIKENAQTVNILLVLNKNEEFDMELRDVKIQLESLAPSPKEDVQKIDKKIKNSLDDLKIALVKSKNDDDVKKAKECLLDVKVLIAQRKVAL